ncbi:hypothetical protein HMPREF1039_0095 [Megasphaera lornae]|uniref:Uncharacterized protein n=1 Tax=Megasphaera lornae TaxID=1000568 RepID=D3LWB1_9FIRM|nr:hypothetical protein HMPREF0889_1254 [Megasphaera genomosp. type_1 str. 28L]EGL41848.1 hypothetical protein HMPREF1039_0095 [Megasphaera lornae]
MPAWLLRPIRALFYSEERKGCGKRVPFLFSGPKKGRVRAVPGKNGFRQAFH